MSENLFDAWFTHTYPDPQPKGTRETALIAWNAGITAAHDVMQRATQGFIQKNEGEKAAMVRDLGEVVLTLRRINE